LKKLALILIVFFLLIFENDFAKADDNLEFLDSLSKKDSLVVKKDSVKLNKPIRRHGSISLMPFNFDYKITKDEFLYNKYQTLTELINSSIFSNSMNMNVSGQFNQLSILGLRPNNINYSLNNRSILSKNFGLMNIDAYSPEYLESIEILTGSKSVVLSSNSSPVLINLQEIKHNAGKPYTKLWYSQGGYDFIGADGVFSQNIAPNLNMTFGFKRISSPGRYENSWSELWNLRGQLRWNIDSNTNISISNNFINSAFGNSGGLNKESSISITDPITAVVYLQASDERNFQHNLNLTFSHLFDSLTTFSSVLFYTSDKYEFKLNPSYFYENLADTSQFSKSSSYNFGINSKFESQFSIFKSISGFDLHYFGNEQSNFYNEYKAFQLAGYEYLTLDFSNRLFLSGGARIILDDKDVKLNFGANLKYVLDYKSFFDFDFSITNRKYNPNEIFKNFENLKIMKIAYNLKGDDLSLSALLGFTQISNFINHTVVNDTSLNLLKINSEILDNISNLNVGINVNYNVFADLYVNLNGIVNYGLSEKLKNTLPLLTLNFDAYYEFKRGASILRLGFQSEGMTQFNGYRFIPFRKLYAYNDFSNAAQFDGLSVYINAKFSSAYVKIIFSNILSQPYYTLPYYPSYDRQFKFIVNWPFLN
jgi:hypothetical protein